MTYTYENLWKRYREDIIDWNEKETRLFYQLRSEMITNAQLQKELEEARELIDTLLLLKGVDKLKNAPEEEYN